MCVPADLPAANVAIKRSGVHLTWYVTGLVWHFCQLLLLAVALRVPQLGMTAAYSVSGV